MVEFAHCSGVMLITLNASSIITKQEVKKKTKQRRRKKSVSRVYRRFYNVCIEIDMMTFIFIAYLRQNIEIATDA